MDIDLSSKEIRELFQFHILFDSNMSIIQVGKAVKKILPELEKGSSLAKNFQIINPQTKLEFNQFFKLRNEKHQFKHKPSSLVLEGQMIHIKPIDELDNLLFICAPQIKDFESLKRLGFNANDISLFNTAPSLLEVIHRSNKKSMDLEKSNQELIKENQQLKEANRTKSEFLNNLNHEIRTPLNTIVGFGQLLLEKAREGEVPEEFVDFIGHIKWSGEKLSELIKNILVLSKIEVGKKGVSYEALNLKQLFQGSYHIFKNAAQEKNLKFNYEVNSNMPDIIESDRSMLNKILMSLLSNAIKFTPEGKTVNMIAEKAGSNILIKVENEGIGIPKDKTKAIFKPFVHANNSIKQQYGGVGLGLAVAKEMVDLLKGEIWVENNEGSGAIFKVEIPIQEEQDEISDEFNQYSNFQLTQNSLVLVIENNAMNQEMMTAFFNEIKVDSQIATTCNEGFEKAKDLQPNIIMVDLNMMSSDDIVTQCKKIKEDPYLSNIPLIAISSDTFKENKELALKNGFNDYLTKPINFDHLIEVLLKHLKKKEVDSKPIKKLPKELDKAILREFSLILDIPELNLLQLDKQLSKIKNMLNDFEHPYESKLKELEDAIFDGNPKAIEALVKKGLN